MNRDVRPVPAGSIESYDEETDVLVVGFGAAGAAAAHESAAAGAEVLVLERAGGAGGSAAQSGGEIYLGGGTDVQRACGFEDTADNMYAFLHAALGPHVDEQKLRLYCDGSVEHFRWLRDRGVVFDHGLHETPTWMPGGTDGLMWLGENAWPYDTVAEPVPRGHRPNTGGFAGWLLMEVLAESAAQLGVRSRVDTRAERLIVDDGRVVGAVATRYGERIAVQARRGVVLTTGGFVDDESMLADHAPHLLGGSQVSDGLDDGSGIRMATALGAATRRMSVTQIALQFVPIVAARGMLVNGLGRRFCNEDVYPGLLSVSAIRDQPGPHWAIIDQEGFEGISDSDLWGVRPTHAAETLAELEGEIGVPAGSLQATVEVYNEHAARGEDPYFHKGSGWLRPLRGPFAAIDPSRGFSGERDSGVGGFTLGGLQTTADGSVLDVSGEPIRGLYAAGRASSGMHGNGYISGTSLGDGTFFGRRAGRTAAAGGR